MEDLKENIYEILRNSYLKGIAPTIRYIESKIDSSYINNITKEYLEKTLEDEKNIIRINNSQYILKESLEKDIKELGIQEDISGFLKKKFLLMEVNRELIRLIFNNEGRTSINDDYLNNNNKKEKYEMFIKEVVDRGYITYQYLYEKSEYYNKDLDDMSCDLIDLGVEFINDKNQDLSEEVNNYDLTDKYNLVEEKDLEDEKNIPYEDKQCSIKTKEMTQGIHSSEIEDENILLLNIGLNEFISGVCLITYIHHYGRGHYKMLNRQFKEMNKFKFITEDETNICITELGEELSEGFYKYIRNEFKEEFLVDLINKHRTTRELSMNETIRKIAKGDKVWEYISDPIIKSYRNNKISKAFLDFLKDANNGKSFSMKELFLFAINNRYDYVLNNILIGDKATSGPNAIKQKTDICFFCPFDRCGKSKRKLESNLLNYRIKYVDNIINRYRNKKGLGDIIRNDPLLIKFMIPYNLTSKNKNLLKKISLIEEDDTIHKKDGMYCINLDKWRIKNSR